MHWFQFYFHFLQYSTYDSEKGLVSCSTDCSTFPLPIQTDTLLNWLSILGSGKSVLERQQGCRVAIGPPMFCFSREISTWRMPHAHEHCHGKEIRHFLLKFHMFIPYYFFFRSHKSQVDFLIQCLTSNKNTMCMSTFSCTVFTFNLVLRQIWRSTVKIAALFRSHTCR